MKHLFGLRELKFLVGLLMAIGGLVALIYSASIPADFDNLILFIGAVIFSVSVFILGFMITESAMFNTPNKSEVE